MKIGTKFIKMNLLNSFTENIEVLQKINSNKTNILSLNLKNIFKNTLIKI